MQKNNDNLQQTSRKPKNIKQHNQKLVLSLLREQDTISVTEIADKTNLSKTTIFKLFADFHEKGLVLSAGKGNSTDVGGKKPELFRLNADYGYVIAFNLFNPRYIECALLDLHGTIRCIRGHMLPEQIPYPDCVERIAGYIVDIVSDTGVAYEDICGVSLGCEGIIDSLTGTIVHSMHHNWERMLPIKQDLATALPFATKIFVENVCRYGGCAELLFAENAQYHDLVTIWSDSFVGGCVMSGQRMVHGFSSLVGEFGHVVIDPRAETQCTCGGSGCLESLIAKETVLANAKAKLAKSTASTLLGRTPLHMEDIFSAANTGDALARSVLDDVIRCYSIFIHNLAGICNPQKIILQGLYVHAGEYFLDKLREQARSFPFYKISNNIEIDYSGYLDDETEHYFIKGAAKYMLDWYFATIEP